jgi:pectate lyase
MFFSIISLAADTPDTNNSTKYLNAVRTFADNVLKYGRDTYGPKHTPLFVDGLNIRTYEPVKWINPDNSKWIISNFASQQILLRTLDGLSKITGDSKYRKAAEEAIQFVFENLRTPNGLFYWGDMMAYDAQNDAIYPRSGSLHSFKSIYPYYELMWKVDPNVTKDFIECLWAAHVKDWSNLDVDRGVGLNGLNVPKNWHQEYVGGPIYFETNSIPFCSTGMNLCYAAAALSKFSGLKGPLSWSKRLAYRYAETRDPRTGFSDYSYTQGRNSHPLAEDYQGHTIRPVSHDFGGGAPSNRDPFIHIYILSPGLIGNYGCITSISEFLFSQMLGDGGREFRQWALEELTARGEVLYRSGDNSWLPMLADGTNIEGYVCKKDLFFARKGTKMQAWQADLTDFWAYALAYKATSDKFMWTMAGNIAQGNRLGYIGVDPTTKVSLNMNTNCSNAHALLGLLCLYDKTHNRLFLDMARRIGDNILAAKFHRGFFVPSNRHTYAKFDAVEALVLLHLYASLNPASPKPPQVWPSNARFDAPYRQKGNMYDMSVIYTLIDSDTPPISINEAAALGDHELANSLLDKGANVNNVERDTFNTPLQLAVQSGHIEVVKLLLEKGADIEVSMGWPPRTLLHDTCQKGYAEITQMLIGAGADVNAKNAEGRTPLDIALRQNNKEIVELLTNVVDIPSIHVAAQVGDLDKVKAFLEKGTDVNAKDDDGMTPLLLAISKKQADVAKFLVENGADVNAGDKSGFVPLVYALWNTDPNVVKILLDNGADVNAEDTAMGFSVLHWAIAMDSKETTELVLTAGADVNTKSNTGETPLDVAAYGVSSIIGELLIANGAEISSLHAAAFMGDLAKVKSLIDKGNDVNEKKGMIQISPLHSAVAGNRKEAAEFLIGKGADVNAQNRAGQTPLHIAAEEGYRDIVQLLVKKGADVNAEDRRGRTPVDLPQNAGQKATVELLVQDVAVTDIAVPATCEQGITISVVATIENRAYSRNSLNTSLIDTTSDQEIETRTVVLLGKRQSKPDLSFDTSNGGIADTGNRVRMNGDMNGDGYKDILLNGPMWNDYRGRVFLYFGGPNLNTIPDMTFSGENPRDRFGDYGAIEISDFNEDGFDDVIIGSLGYPAGKNDGRVYIYYGGADMDTVPDIVFDGETGQHSCFGLTFAGSDIDHDGSVDLLVGAQNYDHGGEYHGISTTREFGPLNGRGRVYLYWGGDRMDTNPDIIFEGENRGDWFGRRISAGGDINGDGYNDILVGARHAVGGSRGRAYLFWGNTRNQINATCDWIFTGEDQNDNMGSSVYIFDIDNDGYSDVILGARFAADYAGRIYIHWGEEDFDGSKPDVVLKSRFSSHIGGDDVTCGYFNDDAYGDILAGGGTWGTNRQGVPNKGHAYLFYGNTKSLIDSECDHIFESEDKEGVENWFGLSVSAGDVNNDNYDDVLIGAPKAYDKAGRAYLYYGPFHNTTDITFTWDTTNASIGKHTLKVEIPPVPGEQNTEDNVKTVEIEIKDPPK